ncbi:MAG: DUF1993 family protein [Pseudomonadota bacterium]
MARSFEDTAPEAIRHYLARIGHLLDRLDRVPDVPALLDRRLAPDMFDTGFHIAVAIRFAGRALMPPNGLDVPDIPEAASLADLRRYHREIVGLTTPLAVAAEGPAVAHRAGEADLRQEPADYVLRFAYPNMIFHLTIAYAALRAAGLEIGKADFDGLHRYDGPA